ncbi:CoA-transferase [Chloroflexota bacterium]
MSAKMRNINEIIARTLELEREGEGKLLTLEEAIKRYVKPKVSLYLACGLPGPTAAVREIVRQYWGENPEFVLIQSAISGYSMFLIYANMVKDLIFSVCPISGPSGKIIQKVYSDKSIGFENWSLCSFQQRLMAGALGVSFMPTRSIIGSNMALDNKDTFQEIEDPFGSKNRTGVVKALNPDVCIVHGCIADVYGNTVLTAPYGEDVWGPRASTNIIVTVEKIVPTDVIRQYSSMVSIPGHTVDAVCEVPLGVHPFGVTNPGINGFDAYGSDREFNRDLQTSFADSDKMDAWIKEWILECPTHEHYLKKLGGTRINSLRGMMTGDLWNYDYSFASPPVEAGEDYTKDEIMSVVAAREIVKSVEKAQHKAMLAGAGAGLLASWLAYYLLRAGGYEIELIQGNGQIGYLPQPGESILRSGSAARSTKMMTDTITTHGVFVGGKHNKCISLLGAGEIDKYGNINSTRTSEGFFLSGSGGGNDSAVAKEVIVVVEQSTRRFVDKIAFITSPGDRVSTIVSSRGVFKRPASGEELQLYACFPDPELKSLEERIAQVQANTGWKLKLAEKVEEVAKPSQEELQLLRSLLPAGMV